MAFQDMAFELAGELNLPMPLVQTKLNEALGQIFDDEEQQMWSFQLGTAGWLTPGLQFATLNGGLGQSAGMITATPFSDVIYGDTLATEAWINKPFGPPLLTQLQIRSPFYSLYNIVAWDGESMLTLDRPWMEPGGLQAYMIYQAYFVAPVKDFKRFIEIRDTMNAGLVDYWTYTQRDLTLRDPQRVIFDMPSHAVFIGWDTRPGSTTPGYPMFELWPNPLSEAPYTFSYVRRGELLDRPSDELPQPLTEDMLKYRTREFLYLFKEAQKGEEVKRGSGADWKFLAQAAAAEYKAARNRIGKRDVSLVDLFFNRFVRGAANRCAPFATINHQLNVGGW